jgi:hypothetical protein
MPARHDARCLEQQFPTLPVLLRFTMLLGLELGNAKYSMSYDSDGSFFAELLCRAFFLRLSLLQH